MNISAIGISKFFVSYLYKRLLSAFTTIAFIFFTDQEKNNFICFILWLLLCTAYFSIPINFERPRKEVFYFFLEKKPLGIIIAITQGFILGAGVYGLTILSLVLCFSLPKGIEQMLSILNGLLYFSSNCLEYSLLNLKVMTDK